MGKALAISVNIDIRGFIFFPTAVEIHIWLNSDFDTKPSVTKHTWMFSLYGTLSSEVYLSFEKLFTFKITQK